MQIQCILGYAETDVMGRTYRFERNSQGHHVAEVADIRHQQCLLSADWAYRKYEPEAAPSESWPDDGPAQDPAPTEPVEPAGGPVPDPEPVGLGHEPANADTGKQPTAETAPPADETTASDPDAVDSAPDKPLEDMSKDELMAEAERLGVPVKARMNKDMIVEAILAAED
ncbi:hypothetical protein [Oricola sp.]|uniref:Rho termination factor N-terminal domain-containing protein n=1 Tax=Oricola sp. TaxID=1979950 RepID=UPI003BA94362